MSTFLIALNFDQYGKFLIFFNIYVEIFKSIILNNFLLLHIEHNFILKNFFI